LKFSVGDEVTYQGEGYYVTSRAKPISDDASEIGQTVYDLAKSYAGRPDIHKISDNVVKYRIPEKDLLPAI
jgi:hypothetical protein